MKHLRLPDASVRILPFYLAMEEYAVRYASKADIFFMWQPAPTVIFGRNQLIDNEVNLDYCRRHGIAVYRRKSGGGCVYADRDNIMLSFITHSHNVEQTYARYTAAVTEQLRQMGLNASVGGRNDILIDGLKVSGNAFYRHRDCSIVHGTMLFATDMQHMTHAITPSKQKLNAKGVQSVQSRITTVSEHSDIDIEQFKSRLIGGLCDDEIMLENNDISEIETIMQSYLSQEFIYGHNPQCDFVRKQRIDGVGEFEVGITLKHNRISRLNIMGDFFILSNVDDNIIDPLIGVNFTRDDVAKALEHVDTEKIILKLNKQQFINLLFDSDAVAASS